MIDFWSDFASKLLERAFEYHVPDQVVVNEDMAYKQKPMIGPDMCHVSPAVLEQMGADLQAGGRGFLWGGLRRTGRQPDPGMDRGGDELQPSAGGCRGE